MSGMEVIRVACAVVGWFSMLFGAWLFIDSAVRMIRARRAATPREPQR